MFNDAIRSSICMCKPSNYIIISEYKIGLNMEGVGHGIMWGTTVTFSGKIEEKHKRPRTL
jgi:hypothetical protein